MTVKSRQRTLGSLFSMFLQVCAGLNEFSASVLEVGYLLMEFPSTRFGYLGQ